MSYAFETRRAYNPAVPRAGSVVVLLVVVQLLVAGPAGANQCRVIDGGTPALAAVDAAVRLRWLDQRLAADAARARIWAWTWRAAYTGITVGEVQVATQPTDAVEDLRLYRAGQLDMVVSKPRLGLAMAPIILRDGGGAALTLRW